MAERIAPRAEDVQRDPDIELRKVLCSAIRQSPYSREEIADRMSAALGRKISVNMVNTWTAKTKRRIGLRAAWIPSFCRASMDDGPQIALLSAEHRTRLEIKGDLESLRRAITALLVAERKRARAKKRGAGRSPQGKKARGKQ